MTANSVLVEKFEYHGKVCVIVQNARINDVFHNGYVRVADSKDKIDVKRKKEEPLKGWDITYEDFLDFEACEFTYCGTLSSLDDVPEGYYFGFDTAHIWNDENPESKGHVAVKEKLKKVVNEMEERNVFRRVKKNEELENYIDLKEGGTDGE